MSGQIARFGTVGAGAHLSVVTSANNFSDGDSGRHSDTTGVQPYRTTGVSYGAAVSGFRRQRELADVRSVALRYDTFEEAVLPMVLASDRSLSGEVAVRVADAVMGNERLRAQAERAYHKARLSAI